MNWLSFASLLIAALALQVSSGTGTISGTVVKSGTTVDQPLRNARLELRGSSAFQVTRTDANGRFMFSNLPAGRYRVSVTSDGFVRQESPQPIALEQGAAATVRFALDPAPTAIGWVLDIYGDPISNIMIEALRRSYDVRGNPTLSRAATALTDDRGEYRIFWLDPGEYFFYAASDAGADSQVQPTSAVAPTYFPGVNTATDARPVTLDIGREVRVDFRLRLAGLWPVMGQTMNGIIGRSTGASITLTPLGRDPNLSRYRATSSTTGPYPGEFVINGVPPGHYILTAKGRSGNQDITVTERIELRPLLSVPRPGYVTSLSLHPPVSLAGRLYVESGTAMDLSTATVQLLAVDSDFPSPQSSLARRDGQFGVPGVSAGNYLVDMSNLPDDLYLKAARYGTEDALAKPLEVKSRVAASPLQILLGTDGGRLSLQSEPGAHLVLVPDAARRGRREQYRTATTDDSGQAALRGIPPGNYKVFAWKRLEPNAHLNADYIQSYEGLGHGTPVIIRPGDNPSLSVPVISN